MKKFISFISLSLEGTGQKFNVLALVYLLIEFQNIDIAILGETNRN